MTKFLLLCGLTILLGSELISGADAGVLVSRGDAMIPIVPAADLWIDQSGMVDAADIVAGRYDDKFRPYVEGQLKRRGGNQWLRVEIENQQRDRQHLVITYEGASAAALELAYRDSSGLHRFRTGRNVPFAERAIHTRLMALPLTIPVGARQLIYLKINLASSRVVILPCLTTELTFAEHTEITDFAPLLIAGAESGVMLLMLVLALGANEWRSVGFYMGMMTSSILMVLAQHGYFAHWTDGTWYGRYSAMIPIWALGRIFVFLFIRSAFFTRERFPLIEYCCWAMIACALLSIPLQIWASVDVLVGYASIFSLVLAPMLVVISLYLVLHRADHARLLLGGMCASALLHVIYVLAVGKIVPYNGYTSYALDAGTVVLVITYTLMLSEKLRHYRAENYHLQTAAAVAQAENRAKSELLAIMSHEIRTPMNGVLGMVELLQCTALDATQQHYANTIQSSGKTLLTVINDILDFSKAEAGKLSLVKQPFDLAELIEETVALYRINASKQVRLVASAAPTMPMRLLGDSIRLQQIIGNLLNNAFKFTERGCVQLRIEPHTITAQRVLLDCRISDTGIGIDPTHRGRLFQAFSQVDNSSHRRFGGTGLGLIICRRLVQLMEGSIDVESTPGEGSTFHFQVWLERDPHAPASDRDSSILEGKLLLAVDDSDDYLCILREQAQALGLRVITVKDPTRAAAVACSERPDIIAIDLDMPGTNGFALDRELATIAALNVIPRILLTASCEPPGAREIEHSGFAAAYSKPTSAPQLQHILLASLTTYYRPLDAAQLPTRSFSEMRVLVAEDNAVNRQVIEAMLQRLGVPAMYASDGAEAVELARQQHYDLILMDCEMPNIDGYRATRTIRQFEQATNRPASIILALSAHALPEYRQRSLDAGMNEHLTKPISIAILEEVLMRYTAILHATGRPP